MSLSQPVVAAETENYLDSIDQEVEVHLEVAAVVAAAERILAEEAEPAPRLKFDRTEGTILGEGSEAELRPDEKVCEVTGLTYHAALPESPHVDIDRYRHIVRGWV